MENEEKEEEGGKKRESRREKRLEKRIEKYVIALDKSEIGAGMRTGNAGLDPVRLTSCASPLSPLLAVPVLRPYSQFLFSAPPSSSMGGPYQPIPSRLTRLPRVAMKLVNRSDMGSLSGILRANNPTKRCQWPRYERLIPYGRLKTIVDPGVGRLEMVDGDTTHPIR
ncbi:hypothetical protein P170DRAFT_198151 [Aspergillus steynii IBT 23096]|uniref:Uncharacterized protein n=1 Tax=Aspergillus steynii IBT 23096 TaxID=1392250 RepID=A0A2I2G4K0_9EURO|nr:uncharacterized protein P170DRAFT_198151 [Aspergillus steynii IBT 23096]PLB47806.1 hypothetical protein P170DRAFT_198151 [Aspergillus steynii IBT 23096]